MTVWVYVRTSTGEERAALDLVKVCYTKQGAIAEMEKDYQDEKSTLVDIVEDNIYDDGRWEISCEDNIYPIDSCTFRGFVEKKEVY